MEVVEPEVVLVVEPDVVLVVEPEVELVVEPDVVVVVLGVELSFLVQEKIHAIKNKGIKINKVLNEFVFFIIYRVKF